MCGVPVPFIFFFTIYFLPVGERVYIHRYDSIKGFCGQCTVHLPKKINMFGGGVKEIQCGTIGLYY